MSRGENHSGSADGLLVSRRASQTQMPDLVASCFTNGRPFVANTKGDAKGLF